MAVLRAAFVFFVIFPPSPVGLLRVSPERPLAAEADVSPSVDYATPLRFSIAAERSIVIAV